MAQTQELLNHTGPVSTAAQEYFPLKIVVHWVDSAMAAWDTSLSGIRVLGSNPGFSTLPDNVPGMAADEQG